MRSGKVQKKNKNKKLQLDARGNNQGKKKSKLAYLLNPRFPLHLRQEDPAKDSVCYHCGDTCHWKWNCPQYLSELLKNKKLPQGASTLGIFTIELFTFPGKYWVYDTGCVTHICNTTQGLRGSRKLKPGALSLYMDNGERVVVEAIGSYHLCFPGGLVIVLNNFYYAPSITRGIISVSCLYDDDFINRFAYDNTILVSKNNLVYFSAIPRDGIYEIDLFDASTNVSSMYVVSNKKAKLNLDSSLLWYSRLGHISKKRIEKLKHDGLLNSIDSKSFEKCVSCLSGKMARNPYSHQDIKSYIGRCFAMKDLGEFAYILGIKIYRGRLKRLIGLCQSAYIEKILKGFFMENYKRGHIPMKEKLKLSKSQGASTSAEVKRMQNVPYALAMGSIMYAVRCTRSDVVFAQNITSRFQQNPGELHWTAVNNILKYLHNTKNVFLIYEGDIKQELRVSCCTDVGYLTNTDDLKSIKQSIFATSSAEAEYIASSDASKEEESLKVLDIIVPKFTIRVRFETYVKAKDLDFWHIILNGDFSSVARNKETQVLEMVLFEQQDDDLKKKLAKNNEAKMVLYNALPKKEYKRIFICKTAKDIWQSLLITHQGNIQVKDNKIDLLVQQCEQFTILEEESIDNDFARYNTIITSFKALDEGFSSKNYVRKFLRALQVTSIEESRDLSSLALDELIGDLKATDGSTIKVHESTLPGSVSRTYGEKGTEYVFSPPMSSRSDFLITRKKLIHNSIDESKKPSSKSGIGLSYPKGTGIETVVYADSDHAGDYVNRKSTSGVCTFMGCCLTSWFAKKQMALAISMTEAEYVSAGKACQQALWMKQALIDYGIRLDDVPIMCDNTCAIDLSTKMPSEYQQGYKKTRAYAPKIYNDPNMFDTLRDIYRNLESRYVQGRTIDPSFYNDLSDDSVAKFTTIGFDCLISLDEQIFHRKMSSHKTKQPKKPPPKRTRNVGKFKRTQLSTSSSTESPPYDNGDFLSTKLSLRSYSRSLKDDPNMSKEQREIRGMFKNLGRVLHNFTRLLKKGCQ
uniref:Putative retrotransposon protein n=1 Tax=Tanacetum cinerariifolium TaxID=118510 RepID=A0A6L2N9D4_TANCI|nr:putative retrotransposon protein [Tanacetum cinerariifolium]